MKKIGIILMLLGLMSLLPVFTAGKNIENSADKTDIPLGHEDYSYQGETIIEMQGESGSTSLDSHAIQGTDDAAHQAYKFNKVREGEEFHYVIAGLGDETYELELSFVEFYHTSSGRRIFDVRCNGTLLPDLSGVDVLSRAGYDYAYQVTVQGVTPEGGLLGLHFKAIKGLAMVSHIRLSAQGETALEIDVRESRHQTYLPLRFTGSEDQDVYEVVLGRFGSRFMINPMPQLLSWQQSPLGTHTEDFSELVLAFRDQEGNIRCLPFTDRYPVFSSIDQELTLTGVSYECSDPALPFQATVTLKAPFYPEDIKTSTAPFFYLDVKVSNPGGSTVKGDLILARAHKDNNTGGEAPRDLDSDRSGYKFKSRYTYGEESHVQESRNSEYFEFWEALAADDAWDIDWHYKDVTSTSWIWDSPEGYPQPYPHEIYTFIPRGYSGFETSFTLEAGEHDSMTAVLACHSSSGVMEVMGDKDCRFIYGDPSGPDLSSVDEVVDFALGSERSTIENKTSFFDGILSESYLSSLPESAYDLTACALQNFICNAWWCRSGSGEEWFSVWEGESYMYHSSVDVEYNNAWFYLYFWPDLLERLLLEWPAFEKVDRQGKYLSHDMGLEHWVNGMTYPHDMPVEENTDYVILLYAYWKSTGDTALLRSEFGHARDYTEFIFNCDTDGDGIPDINVDNTVDQGSPAIQDSRNQTYLGVKALAAYRAAVEMARAQEAPDEDFIASCEERIHLINLTLENELWLGDHFAVCGDQSVPAIDRDAYSIYASNGLLYVLSSSTDAGLTPANLERFRIDLNSSTAATSRRYGSVHTSVNNENQWVSQNLWRDALGYWLEVGGWPQGQEERFQKYWDLEHYFASTKNGGFWDVCAYNEGSEERHGVMRGAFSPDFAFDQSLGYYSRGVDVLALVSASARLRVDLASGSVLFDPAGPPCRVPVLRCADWGASDPEKRIPVLIFDVAGELEEVLNRHLLPETLQQLILSDGRGSGWP